MDVMAVRFLEWLDWGFAIARNQLDHMVYGGFDPGARTGRKFSMKVIITIMISIWKGWKGKEIILINQKSSFSFYGRFWILIAC